MENDTINMKVAPQESAMTLASPNTVMNCEAEVSAKYVNSHEEKLRVNFSFDFTLPVGSQEKAIAAFLKVKDMVSSENFGTDSRMSFSVNQW